MFLCGAELTQDFFAFKSFQQYFCRCIIIAVFVSFRFFQIFAFCQVILFFVLVRLRQKKWTQPQINFRSFILFSSYKLTKSHKRKKVKNKTLNGFSLVKVNKISILKSNCKLLFFHTNC